MTAGTLKSSSLDLTRPGIIEASAGTGKTFTLAEIYLALLCGEKNLARRERVCGGEDEKIAAVPDARETDEKKISPPRVGEILVVTFTNAATAELRDRLRRRIRDALAAGKKSETAADSRERLLLRLADSEFDEAAVFTIHGFCRRVLTDFGISARAGEIIASPGDELSRFAARWRARKIAAGEKIFFGITPKKICAVLSPLLQNPEIVPVLPRADDALGNALFCAADEAFPEWIALRESAKNISYGEILLALRDALRASPELAKKIAARFRVAVVDEFQDTDPVQWEIFRRIFLANRRPIFCVGDPKQAIYEFRGGDLRTYRLAREEIRENGGGNAMTLGENFRSAPETIAAFNEIFSFDAKISGGVNAGTPKNPRAIDAAFAASLEYAPVAFPRVKAAELDAEELAARERIPAAILKIAPAATSKSVAKTAVAERVVADIADLVRERGVPADEIAVLAADNGEANLYRAMLAKVGVPVSTTARGNVLCEPIARSLADILRAMLEPQNTAVFRRALLSPFFAGTGKRLLLRADDEKTAAETEAARQAFAEAHARWVRGGFLPAFRALSERLCFSENISALPAAETLATNIAHLAELIHARERAAGLSPRTLADAFDAMLASANPADDSDDVQLRADSDGAAVRILTVHKSKGLEFGTVFIPSLWADSFLPKTLPDFTKRDGGNARTEMLFDAAPEKEKSDAFVCAAAENAGENAARLFYVALTRARSRVVVYHVPQNAKGARAVWDSYQKKIFEAAGFFSENADAAARALPHWKIVPAESPLPEDAFPQREKSAGTPNAPKTAACPLISPDAAHRRFAEAETALKKIARDAESVFSFSKIIHATESDNAARREDDENQNPAEAENALPADENEKKSGDGDGEISFPRQSFSDLPVGAEFGTLAHLVFEKTDFRSRENLPELLDSVLPLLPNFAGAPDAERRALKKKFAEMVARNLALPLPIFGARGFRLEELGDGDAAHEMEFHFPLKRSRDLYAGLFRIFTDWGGIYAETAERHWAPNASADAGTALNVGGMMTGVIDLAFRADGKFFILDWKTNLVAARGNVSAATDFRLPAAAIREEIVKHDYALQWTIYALALRKFLRRSLGEAFDWDRDFGGAVYLFVRWLAPYFETGTLTSSRLDRLESLLATEIGNCLFS